MTLLFAPLALVGAALAAPGLRTEGVVMATSQGEGALYTTTRAPCTPSFG